MIDNRFYCGFEDEADLILYYTNSKNEYVGYKIWIGYFENILSGCFNENIQLYGLLNSYMLHNGWYDESPWKINNIDIAILELEQYKEEELENDIINMLPTLRVIRNMLIAFLKKCKDNNFDVYIEYDT